MKICIFIQQSFIKLLLSAGYCARGGDKNVEGDTIYLSSSSFLVSIGQINHKMFPIRQTVLNRYKMGTGPSFEWVVIIIKLHKEANT